MPISVLVLFVCMTFGIPAQDGHRCALVGGAVQVRILPARGIYSFRGFSRRHDRFYVDVSIQMRNVSNEVVQVGSCSAVAVDAGGHPLFPIGPASLAGYPELAYAEFNWILRPAGVGAHGKVSYSVIAPKGATLVQVQAVDHFDAQCEVFHWVGPMPQTGGD